MAETLVKSLMQMFLLLSRRGKLLGFAVNQQIENDRMKKMIEDRQFPEEYTNNLFNIT